MMVRNYIKKNTYQNWSKEAMCMAITECLNSQTRTVTEIAREHNIPISTLRRRIKKYKNSKNHTVTPDDIWIGRYRPTFTAEQEELLKNYIIHTGDNMTKLQIIDIRRMVYDFAEVNNIPHRFNKEQKMAGDDWFYSFVNRHPDIFQRFHRTKSANNSKESAGFNDLSSVKNEFIDCDASQFLCHELHESGDNEDDKSKIFLQSDSDNSIYSDSTVASADPLANSLKIKSEPADYF